VTYDVEIGGRVRRVDVARAGAGFRVSLDGRTLAADVTVLDGVWSLILSPDAAAAPRRSYEIAIEEDRAAPGRVTVQVGGRSLVATVDAARRRADRAHDAGTAAAGPLPVRAPMPGRVVRVLVKAGDRVEARQALVVVEAMKMENELRAPRAGTVAEVRVAEGASVDAGAVLAVIQ
jgi:biotin carboxyl carrier protein